MSISLSIFCQKRGSSIEPFFADISWNEYLTLSDEEQGELWDEASGIDIMDLYS